MSLKVKFILILFLIVVSRISSGNVGGYVALDWNLSVTQSDSEFNNGASGGSPGFLIGQGFKGFILEAFYKNITMENEHTNQYGKIDVTIEDSIIGVGVRFSHGKLFASKVGYAFHDVEAKYGTENGVIFNSTIDGRYSGFYLGGGLKGEFASDFEYFGDLTFYLASTGISLYTMEIGLRYFAF